MVIFTDRIIVHSDLWIILHQSMQFSCYSSDQPKKLFLSGSEWLLCMSGHVPELKMSKQVKGRMGGYISKLMTLILVFGHSKTMAFGP